MTTKRTIERKEGETDKPKGQPGPETRRSYYVPRLKEYCSITDLTQEDRESIADNLFGPSEAKERGEFIRQLKKLAEDREKTPGLIEDAEPTGEAPDEDEEAND